MENTQTYHILNGDCLAAQLSNTSIRDNFLICRECLIEGPVHSEKTEDFWNARAQFIANTYGADKAGYYNSSVSEFQKTLEIPANARICLWFEDDLFCQINMWFICRLINPHKNQQIYRVFPKKENGWKGFSNASTTDLEQAYLSKIKFTTLDLELAQNLWKTYQSNNLIDLKELSKANSKVFRHLPAVCEAQAARFPTNGLSRPQEILKKIIENGAPTFWEAYTEFSELGGIYGFGDSQLKNIYNSISNHDKES